MQNEIATLEQINDLIEKETQNIVAEINANTTIVQQTADAQASVIVKESEYESFKIIQGAIGEGLQVLMEKLNVTTSIEKQKLFDLLSIIDNKAVPQVVSGAGKLNLLVNS